MAELLLSLRFLVSLVFLGCAANAQIVVPKVETPCGVYHGIYDCSLGSGAVSPSSNACLAEFLGVRYAQPPTGSLRWMPPAPAACPVSPSPYRAWKYGSHCIQFGADPLPFEASEDCLFLNIFVQHAALANESSPLLPVMLFVHGGDSTDGMSDYYDGMKSIAATNPVVLVTLNYRLNAFGFLALPELSARDPRGVSGNYGILDQREALVWIQKNVRYFKGDPSRVTVFGQSSGGTHILGYLAAPSFRNLFHVGISLSGSPNISMPLSVAEELNGGFAANCGCTGKAASESGSSDDVVSCLLNVSAAEIPRCLPEIWHNGIPNSPPQVAFTSQPGIVIVDGVTLVTDVFSAAEAALVDVPFIFASMAQEIAMGPVDHVTGQTRAQFVQFLEKMWTPRWSNVTLIDDILDMYGNDTAVFISTDIPANATAFGDAQWFYDTIGSDAEVTCGNVLLSRAAASKFQSPVYSSYTTQGPSHPMFGRVHAFHTWDMVSAGHLWDFWQEIPSSSVTDGRLARSTSAPQIDVWVPKASDLQLGDRLRRHWVDLATHLRMTDSSWKPVQEAMSSAVINSTATTSVADLLTAKCSLWASIGAGKDYWWAN